MNYFDIQREIEGKQFSSVNDAIQAIGKLSDSLKQALYQKIERLDNNMLNEAQKRQVQIVAELWNPIIDWSCNLNNCQMNSAIESTNVVLNTKNTDRPFSRQRRYHRRESNYYQVAISCDLEKLVDNYLIALCSMFGNRLLRYSDKALLDDLYMHYRHLSNCSGQEVNPGANGKLSSIEEDLEWLMEMHFRVKTVEFEGEYANGDYFEMRQANISQPKTIKKALVSIDDGGDLCIQKGLFVSPFNNSNDD